MSKEPQFYLQFSNVADGKSDVFGPFAKLHLANAQLIADGCPIAKNLVSPRGWAVSADWPNSGGETKIWEIIEFFSGKPDEPTRPVEFLLAYDDGHWEMATIAVPLAVIGAGDSNRYAIDQWATANLVDRPEYRHVKLFVVYDIPMFKAPVDAVPGSLA